MTPGATLHTMETSHDPVDGHTLKSSPLEPHLEAQYERFVAESPVGADEDVHMLPAIVEHVIQRCTSPDNIVLDPFAGFGTTLDRAVTLGRQAIGVELLSERVTYLRRHVSGARILQGDARRLTETLRAALPDLTPGSVDLILTSPPYMTAQHHPADPLSGYVANDGDYGRYLRELSSVAAQCARLIAPAGYVVWNVADIQDQGHTTQLIADCARVLAGHLELVGITEIVWDRYPHDLICDALLIFQRP